MIHILSRWGGTRLEGIAERGACARPCWPPSPPHKHPSAHLAAQLDRLLERGDRLFLAPRLRLRPLRSRPLLGHHVLDAPLLAARDVHLVAGLRAGGQAARAATMSGTMTAGSLRPGPRLAPAPAAAHRQHEEAHHAAYGQPHMLCLHHCRGAVGWGVGGGGGGGAVAAGACSTTEAVSQLLMDPFGHAEQRGSARPGCSSLGSARSFRRRLGA